MTAVRAKRAVAVAAADLVRPGMLVGLGTGSTAALWIDELIRRAREGLSILCVPTSDRSAEQARAGGLTVMAEPPSDRLIDLTIDGADEIEDGTLNLIKGAGGALLREKIVAACSRELVVIADAGKRVRRLGERFPVPVEVVPFGWRATARRINALGGVTVPRLDEAGGLFLTDGGNHILDCRFPAAADLAALAPRLEALVGVIETGLFIGMASAALIGGETGVERVARA
jgi:ribose 5-phosphate isomerase A